jgi:hypothetical protein
MTMAACVVVTYRCGGVWRAVNGCGWLTAKMAWLRTGGYDPQISQLAAGVVGVAPSAGGVAAALQPSASGGGRRWRLATCIFGVIWQYRLNGQRSEVVFSWRLS